MSQIEIQSVYDRRNAVAYAHLWAYGRNPQYYNFDPVGGDCTNFASQCLFAGCKVMNYSQTNGWYYNSSYDRTPAWSGVNFLYDFLTTSSGSGPYAKQVAMAAIEPGDIIQLAIGHPYFHHSPVVIQVGETPSLNNILVAAHTYNSDYRPISSYPFHSIRFLHIVGVRN